MAMRWRRVFAAWLVIVVAESIHGVLRQFFIAPVLGDLPARQLGVVVGSAIIFAVAWLGIRWIGARSFAEQLKVGLAWVAAILAFEFSLGAALGYTRERMLSDYDVTRGGYLGFGLLVMLLAPALAAQLRGVAAGDADVAARAQGRSAAVLELRIPPLAVATLACGGMWAAAKALPQLALPLPASSIVAALLVTLGGGVGLAGILSFRASRTTVNPMRPGAASSLVHAGVYRYSRNPMYLGVALALAGWAAYLANAAALVLVPGFVIYMNRFQIGPEERALLEKFGATYARYLASVRRWI
jgi:protein-S-isoprenylcysteine O-methyltransferase Ste14